MGILAVCTKRDIDPALGTITPGIIEELKDNILDEMEEDLLDHIEHFNLVKWHIDAERREISGELLLKTVDTV